MTTAKTKAKSELTNIHIQEIPEALKADFKAACAKRNLLIRDAFVLIAKKFIAETP